MEFAACAHPGKGASGASAEMLKAVAACVKLSSNARFQSDGLLRCTAGCMQVETPVAVVDKNVNQRSSRTRAVTIRAAHDFVAYLFSREAQEDFAASGFRHGPGMCPRCHVPASSSD